MQQPGTLKKGPRWTVPRVHDQRYHMVENTWLNARPKFVLVFHLESNGTRTAHEMHLRDAEEVIKNHPNEWSRFASATAEPARPAEPTPLDRLGDLERDLRDLQARLAVTRRELAATGKGN